MRRPDFTQRKHGLTPAERGTAHHLFMQFCDFDACAAGRVGTEIERLRTLRILSPEQADAVEPARIEAFFASDFYQNEMRNARVRREFKFSVVVPAADYYPETAGMDETVLLQGVIDCLLETDAGFTILDFKTDRVTPGTMTARAAGYAAQLDAYAAAVARIFGRPVTARVLYFFAAQAAVRL